MDIQQQIFAALSKIESKVDQVDSKLDKHAERIAVVEEVSKQNAGMIKLALTGFITFVASIITYVWNSISNK